MTITARFSSWLGLLGVVGAVAATAPLVGCSGQAGGGAQGKALPENTGAIVARLSNIPADVQCITLQTSDSLTSYIQQDVTPGGDATIELAPLNPGYLWLSGQAYNHPCESWYVGGEDGGVYGGSSSGGGSSSSSGGGADPGLTWEATPTYVNVLVGQTTETTLHFHQLGTLDVNVSFDNDTCDNSFGGCDDAGPPPPVEDAGPPILVGGDAGAAPVGFARR
jgi:hypothetical protein